MEFVGAHLGISVGQSTEEDFLTKFGVLNDTFFGGTGELS
jgi:hypothetical protein